MLFSYVATALRQLRRNTGRSILTMLGIIIGIGSVIFIMTTGELAKQFLLGQITQFGTNVVEVASPGTFGPGESLEELTLTQKDIEIIENSDLLPEVTGISAGYFTTQTMEYQDESMTVTVNADYPGFFSVNNMRLKQGRFYTSDDVERFQKVVVIEEPFAKDVFGSVTQAIGETIKIGGKSFRVIGVMEQMSFGPSSFGFGSVVYAPITTTKQLFADPADMDEIGYLLVQFEPGTEVESFKNRLTYVINQAHDLLETDSGFTIISREQALDIFNNVLLGIQLFVSAVASISLLVGGIGIMNIMLVTVSERTKEIGLRKAIGAKNYSILTQFLVESVVLTTVGGLIGIAGGLGLTELVVVIMNVVQPDWNIQFVFVPLALVLACGVIVSLGILFGIYPALKASRLSPMEALRYE